MREEGRRTMILGKALVAKCFACERKLGGDPHLVDTRNGLEVFVESECYKLIEKAGETGYQSPSGGPRLWLLRYCVRKLMNRKQERNDRRRTDALRVSNCHWQRP
jgi:hypothetical protein